MIKKRVILWWMLFTGILVHMFQKTNINIAITSMVKHSVGPNQVTSKVCDNNTFFNSLHNLYSPHNLARTPTPIQDDTLPWDEHTQNLVLGAFFWFAWLAQFLGGMLSHKYGSKLTFGLSNFIACLLSAAIPPLADIDASLVIGVRVIQGFIGSLGIPAGILTIMGNWAPPEERGRFTSSLLGIAFSIAIGYPVFGTIGQYFGWRYIFYVTTVVGTIWYALWHFVVFDSPDDHPTITIEEQKYINERIGTNLSKKELTIPWRHILLSVPFLMNVLCQFGAQWCVQTLNIYTPSYLTYVFGLDQQTSGIISGVPFLFKSILSYFAGSITDLLIRRKLMSTQNVRKFSVFISSILSGIILLGIPYAGCAIFLAISCLTVAITTHAFFLTGSTVAILDMSPNFSSVLQGICGIVSVSAGFIAPLVTDLLPFTNIMMEKWNWIFIITSGVNMATGVMFILFSNSNLQPWNSPDYKMKAKKTDDIEDQNTKY